VKVVLDTNVFISALLTPLGRNRKLIEHWQNGSFALLTSEAQIDELKRTLNREQLRLSIRPHRIGALVNLLRVKATIVVPGQVPSLSPDPDDNAILAIALAGKADILASLNMKDIVELGKLGGTRLVHAAELLALLEGATP
jgi:putative PIN family toxin of toxin-antitoxin system